jgi:hypothetical protein
MDQMLEHLTFLKRTITKTNKKWCWFHKSSTHSASNCRTLKSRQQLNRYPSNKNSIIQVANDTLFDVLGVTEVFITVGNSCVQVSCIVVRSFPYSLLLGNDTLHKFGATISFGNQQLLVRNTSVSVSILKACRNQIRLLSTVLKILLYHLVR